MLEALIHYSECASGLPLSAGAIFLKLISLFLIKSGQKRGGGMSAVADNDIFYINYVLIINLF